MKTISEIIEELSHPITRDEVEWKPRTGGISGDRPWVLVLAYIDARAAITRLNKCCTWQDRYIKIDGPIPKDEKKDHLEYSGFICELSIYDSETDTWITRSDGSSFSDIDPFKGSISGALKRACSKFGMGIDLYDLPVTYANCTFESMKGKPGWKSYYDKKSSKTIWWQIPDIDGIRGKSQGSTPPPKETPKNTSDEDPFVGYPRDEIPPSTNPEPELPKGDFEKASAALRSAATKDEYLRYSGLINERSWTNEERLELRKLILELNTKFNIE